MSANRLEHIIPKIRGNRFKCKTITAQLKQSCLGIPGMAGGWDLLYRQLGGNLLQMSSTRVNWEIDTPRISLYIMTFHVSTGRSASLKLQSNFSAATGSSVGS